MKALLCDIGNVLLFFDHQRGFKQMADLLQVDVSAIRQKAAEIELFSRYETGRISTDEVGRQFIGLSSLPIPSSDLFQAWCDIFVPNDPMFPIIQELKKLGIRLVLLSNISEAHHHHIASKYDWFHWFDEAVLSYQVGAMKPTHQIFEAAINAAKCDPQDCFYLDDVAEYVEAAKRLEIPSHQFVSMDGLRKAVTERLPGPLSSASFPSTHQKLP